MFKKKFLITSLLAFFCLNLLAGFVSAQVQEIPFSGNDPASYQCIGEDGQIDSTMNPVKDPETGYFVCPIDRDHNDKFDKAVLKPVKLQQVEIWVKRIVYIIWSLVASYSFILLVALGFQYMLRGGTSDTELVTLRKKIIYYIIGFCLVFLAIPILTTFFNLLNINTDVKCYDVNMPGFQFFFASLCTDPNNVTDPCEDYAGGAVGILCPNSNETRTCYVGSQPICYKCTPIPNSTAGSNSWQFCP